MANPWADFAQKERLSLRAERCCENPHMEPSAPMDHWCVRLRQGRRQFTTYFSMGCGHNGKKPTIEPVLECLASDCTEETFEEWAQDLGYDRDSRKALATYTTIQRQTKRLARFLGPAFDRLLAIRDKA